MPTSPEPDTTFEPDAPAQSEPVNDADGTPPFEGATPAGADGAPPFEGDPPAADQPDHDVLHDDPANAAPREDVGHDDQGTVTPAGADTDVSRNIDGAPVDPAQAQPTPTHIRATELDEHDLPEGTAYATPDGVIGVIGYDYRPQRPLQGANMEALFAFAHETRKESTYH